MRAVIPTRTVNWTKERITALSTPEVKQLRINAERLNSPEIMALCDAVLGERPRGGGVRAAKPKTGPARPRKKKTLEKKTLETSEAA